MKIKAHNDWGTIYYLKANDEPRDIYKGKSLRMDLLEGMEASVVWPDGTQEHKTITAKAHSEHVSDMGRGYMVHGKMYGFLCDYHGVSVWIPIENADDVILPRLP